MKTSFLARLLPLVLVIVSTTARSATDAGDLAVIDALISEYGKTPIIELIVKKRYGEVTISRGSSLSSTFGRPNKKLVSARTIRADLEKMKMSVAEFSEALRSKLNKDKQEHERLQQDVPEATGRASAPNRGSTTSRVMVRRGERDPACVKSCLARLKSCMAPVNAASKKCSRAPSVEKCLKKNGDDALACQRAESNCEDGCFR